MNLVGLRAMAFGFLFVAVAGACGASSEDDYRPPPLEGGDGGGVDAPKVVETVGACVADFRYVPPVGKIATSVAVVGEWNSFAAPGEALVSAGDGSFSLRKELPIGLHAYKFLVDGTYEFDAGAPLRKYVGGVENSAVRVADCAVPTLEVVDHATTRVASGQGTFSAKLRFVGQGRELLPGSYTGTLKRDGVAALGTVKFEGDRVTASALEDGKYTLLVEAKSKGGATTTPLRLVFWIEAEAFDWRDAVIYMVMTDRFSDGDKGNNVAPPPGVDPRTVYKGGDLVGVKNVIDSGYLDQLGVRAIWLSPFQTNPAGPFMADDGVNQATGYHGYWPTRAREVDPRLGGKEALLAMVKSAHAHGIRILMDYVVNHVHKDHEYFVAHPEWFRTGCVCGTNNCDWTAKRLDCLFTDYLPDVNWTVPAVSEQFGDDATFWIDTFDLDGLRIDAVKHVEDLAIRNLAARVRSEFEAAGTRLFLTGETAMGWSDCGVACNANDYGTIARYIGPFGLDGQFDFVLHHAAPYRVFAYDQKGLIHADFWTQTSLTQYPAGAIMTPYIGSHDTPRFQTLASYRGQDGAHDPGIAGNKWTNAAGPPPDEESYQRHRLALSWLYGLPGAPLLYYGDEYGEWGGADPNNRSMWRTALSASESSTLTKTKALGKARRELVALRRGSYRSVYAAENQLIVAREMPTGDVALVAINRANAPVSLSVPLPVTLKLSSGVIKDRLGGTNGSVTAGVLTLDLPARSSAVLAP